MDIEVYADRIIIKKIDIELRTEGGIILGSEVEKERETAFGRVLAVGEGKVIDNTGALPIKTKKGDVIAFNERIPRRFIYLGEQYYILRETDVDFKIGPDDLKEVVEKPYELEGYEYDKGVKRVLN